MSKKILCALVLLLASGVALAQLPQYSFSFTLQNTGSGVNDGRLRFHIDNLAVPGEDYFIDNVTLNCGGPEILVNGDFSSGQAPWKFYTNAPVPKPTLTILGGEAVISFGNDGSNTQLYLKDLVLPAAGTECTLAFDACSTGGPGDPGFGHNFGIKLIKHSGGSVNYGLNLSGNPANPDVDLISCSAGTFCGDGGVDTPNTLGQTEQCDDGNTTSGDGCDAACVIEFCGDAVINNSGAEQCDDGNAVGGDGCDSSCGIEPFCGNGIPEGGEFCDNGGGTITDQTTTETDACDTDCTMVECGDGMINGAAGEQCDDGNSDHFDGCDAECQVEAGDVVSAVCSLFEQLGATPVPLFCGFESAIGIILLPSQDTTVFGEPHQDIYDDASLVWPVSEIIYRVLPLPYFAGGVESPASIADTMEVYVNELKSQGVKKFIFPLSTSVMTAWLSGNTTAMGGVPYATRHPSIVGATMGSAGNTAGDFGTEGNLYVFNDYLSDPLGSLALSCQTGSIPTGGLVYVIYEDSPGDIGEFLPLLVSQRKAELEAVGLTVDVFAVSQPEWPSDSSFDFSNVTNGAGVGGLDLANEIATNNPDAIDSGWYFSADNFVSSARDHGGILLDSISHFGWFSLTELIPVDVSYGCSTIPVLNGLNEESLKVGFPTTNCAWDSGNERVSGAGYGLVEMFAFLATDLEYRGPENMLRFRANGVRIDPYVIGGRGLFQAANTFVIKKDRVLRNPIWEDDTLGNSSDVIDIAGPFDQDFGFCQDSPED